MDSLENWCKSVGFPQAYQKLLNLGFITTQDLILLPESDIPVLMSPAESGGLGLALGEKGRFLNSLNNLRRGDPINTNIPVTNITNVVQEKPSVDASPTKSTPVIISNNTNNNTGPDHPEHWFCPHRGITLSSNTQCCAGKWSLSSSYLKCLCGMIVHNDVSCLNIINNDPNWRVCPRKADIIHSQNTALSKLNKDTPFFDIKQASKYLASRLADDPEWKALLPEIVRKGELTDRAAYIELLYTDIFINWLIINGEVYIGKDQANLINSIFSYIPPQCSLSPLLEKFEFHFLDLGKERNPIVGNATLKNIESYIVSYLKYIKEKSPDHSFKILISYITTANENQEIFNYLYERLTNSRKNIESTGGIWMCTSNEKKANFYEKNTFEIIKNETIRISESFSPFYLYVVYWEPHYTTATGEFVTHSELVNFLMKYFVPHQAIWSSSLFQDVDQAIVNQIKQNYIESYLTWLKSNDCALIVSQDLDKNIKGMILFTVDPYLLNIPLRIEASTAIMASIWNIVSRTTTPQSIFNSYLEKWQAIISELEEVQDSVIIHFLAASTKSEEKTSQVYASLLEEATSYQKSLWICSTSKNNLKLLEMQGFNIVEQNITVSEIEHYVAIKDAPRTIEIQVSPESIESETVNNENSVNNNNSINNIVDIKPDPMQEFRDANLKNCEKYVFNQKDKSGKSLTNSYLEIYIEQFIPETTQSFVGCFLIERIRKNNEKLLLHQSNKYIVDEISAVKFASKNTINIDDFEEEFQISVMSQSKKSPGLIGKAKWAFNSIKNEPAWKEKRLLDVDGEKSNNKIKVFFNVITITPSPRSQIQTPIKTPIVHSQQQQQSPLQTGKSSVEPVNPNSPNTKPPEIKPEIKPENNPQENALIDGEAMKKGTPSKGPPRGGPAKKVEKPEDTEVKPKDNTPIKKTETKPNITKSPTVESPSKQESKNDMMAQILQKQKEMQAKKEREEKERKEREERGEISTPVKKEPEPEKGNDLMAQIMKRQKEIKAKQEQDKKKEDDK